MKTSKPLAVLVGAMALAAVSGGAALAGPAATAPAQPAVAKPASGAVPSDVQQLRTLHVHRGQIMHGGQAKTGQ